MKTKTQLTYSDLETQISALRDRLDDCRDLQKENDAKVRAASTLVTVSREFATAYHAHPWSHEAVYEAGLKLIKAARQV